MTSRRLFSSSSLAAVLGACLLAHGAAAGAQEIDTLARIKQTGVIHIGNRDSSIPFSYSPRGGGDPVGFSNDICLKIVDAVKAKLGLPALRVQYTLLNSLNRIPLMQNGTVDLDCATTTNSVVRQQMVAFAPSHFVAGITVAVKKNSGINSLSDLAGKTVATVAGSTSVQLLRTYKRTEALDVRELSGKDTADAFLLLANGRADAYVLDDVQLAGLIASSPNPGEYRMLRDVVLRQEPYGIMLRKNDPQFEALVDETVTQLMKSGEMERLYARWFTQPIPPNNVNLNFPMTEAVREAYRNPSKKGV
ncbi:amino acid ABC transporter substrate-binding protein [Paracidovorax cattleyae]|uniref:Amino acid ABC transporter substrate-binding protein, PAAT family n=1 Tax=Paracidovorax cattleyae TaxID=80868 RepID=A0A1H0V213_9BURK|nr:amino acid ABC transporter substrate-binding protein [Paracidovorax cattleyae]AVS72781.1 amino acid ABC transporter substrate-binding protein [Paracidovorax cattleyae]MBF9266665.1 amino acid ABC transporter substrate-binding protein [Paracidovorax cattleyae]SDP72599.1 amino acid ABC transporter substrate-binding protein, PAAT family [Paracidovorax cattleyae]